MEGCRDWKQRSNERPMPFAAATWRPFMHLVVGSVAPRQIGSGDGDPGKPAAQVILGRPSRRSGKLLGHRPGKTTRRTISCDGEASVAETRMGLPLRDASCATIFRLR
ncbi:hypothetical protein BMJ32_20220 [Sinorhizobium medicae]|uniref:Uncharacterized protein n=1 Tax=Sinorhizobium medicae (strain WSM419) TaxID=366394 RepID=A6UKK7_SINMW|nr:hypothetical protein Smed_5422 [Sinorhizobium medicae WSM419]MDX0411628.1 hypothetical protein [Sinorhizobium medicae]MDX0427032.1 hypothetical protein [Sinorhizobium medicae]MDX0475234.1 hypothetical protein [Sinorhizobium medicae]MDX0537051.1 hypothetical protein [Sinorhizobium medicae]